jgi:3-isopropylmalate/(R)-2-methylmalate dehydratase small subunit
MNAFVKLSSKVVALPASDVDTDQIIPARFLKVIDKAGLGDHLFADWRYLPDGSPRPDFPLNRAEAQGASILLAGDNFGCGSSREHAPWALWAWGIRAVISTSFADIFSNNALKNGLLPVRVGPETLAQLFAAHAADPGVVLSIDLAREALTLPGGSEVNFPIDPFAKRCLIQGVDELGYLQSFEREISAHERTYA